jgi:hypothetical protein
MGNGQTIGYFDKIAYIKMYALCKSLLFFYKLSPKSICE